MHNFGFPYPTRHNLVGNIDITTINNHANINHPDITSCLDPHHDGLMHHFQ